MKYTDCCIFGNAQKEKMAAEDVSNEMYWKFKEFPTDLAWASTSGMQTQGEFSI